MRTPTEWARFYIVELGWAAIPIPYQEKAPRLKGWQQLKLTADNIAHYFHGQPQNVGVLLGAPSGNLIDIDLDSAEALTMASVFLPPTPCKFGRASKPLSHWLYVLGEDIRTEKFTDPEKFADDATAMLVELRSTGAQTVFPGSVHPSGEDIDFERAASGAIGEPARPTTAELRGAVVRLAVASLLARHWPGVGTRQATALAAAGFLLRARMPENAVAHILVSVECLVGDPADVERRREAARDTARKLAAGGAVTGGPALKDLLTGDGARVVRQIAKWVGAAGAPGAGGRGRPEIYAREGDLTVITAEAWAALRAANESAAPLDRLYRRDRRLTRVERDDLGAPVLVPPLTPDQLRYRMITVAWWYRLTKKGEPVAARPPKDVLTNMLADPEPPVPTLLRLTTTPFFTASGALVTTPGYNAESRLLYVAPPEFALPAVPETPTAADLERARTLLMDDLVGDFPFTSAAERATAAAFYVTLFARELIAGPVPLFEFEKPTIGTGCTLCVQALVLAALGRLPDPLTVAEDDAENRKLITATLLAGSPILWFDNVTTLDSGTFARALTSEMWGDRLLGKNDLLSLVNRALWVTTGNNPTISAEILRRSVRGRMDARVEKPWERRPEEFRHPELLSWVRAARGPLVWAGLTLVQGWLAAGRPAGPATLGSFEVWARTLSGILTVADIPGLLENKTALFDRATTRDAAMRAVVAWWDEYRGLGRSTRELAQRHPDAVDALELGGETLQERHVRLGIYLKTCQDKTYTAVVPGVDVQLVVAGTPKNATLWQLRPVNQMGGTGGQGG